MSSNLSVELMILAEGRELATNLYWMIGSDNDSDSHTKRKQKNRNKVFHYDYNKTMKQEKDLKKAKFEKQTRSL